MTWISLLMCVHRCVYACVCVCACVWCVCPRACVTSCFELPVNVVECYPWRVLAHHQFKDKRVTRYTRPRDHGRPLGQTAWKCYMVCVYKSNVAVTLAIRSNSTALDRCAFTSAMEWLLDRNLPKSQILRGLVWLSSSTMEREGDGIHGLTPDGIQVAFVFLHQWTWQTRTNICNSYTFGDELKGVCQPWDDVSGVIRCAPVSQKNTYIHASGSWG